MKMTILIRIYSLLKYGVEMQDIFIFRLFCINRYTFIYKLVKYNYYNFFIAQC